MLICRDQSAVRATPFNTTLAGIGGAKCHPERGNRVARPVAGAQGQNSNGSSSNPDALKGSHSEEAA